VTTPRNPEDFALLREDLAYHQARVLLLIDAVAAARGHQGKVDGLTKLAKLDFLLRYPALAPVVLDALSPADPRLGLHEEETGDPANVEAPMIRYKYGPWDDRYYAVIGALVSRNLLRYVGGRRGSVALAPTPTGRAFAAQLAAADEWSEIADRSNAIAESSAGLSGNALKDLIYQRLGSLMDRKYGEVIR
jgi:hypothetical protein